MAQIHIQPKRRRLWPWVVGIIAGALLAWLLFRWLGRHQDPGEIEIIPPGQTTEQTSTQNPSEL